METGINTEQGGQFTILLQIVTYSPCMATYCAIVRTVLQWHENETLTDLAGDSNWLVTIMAGHVIRHRCNVPVCRKFQPRLTKYPGQNNLWLKMHKLCHVADNLKE